MDTNQNNNNDSIVTIPVTFQNSSNTLITTTSSSSILQDSSNTLLYSQQCIICLQSEPILDLCSNVYCSCNFTYHVKCYSRWQETQQYKKCFLCNTPIINIKNNTMVRVNPIHNALHHIDSNVILANTDTSIQALSPSTNAETDGNIHLVEMTSYEFRLFRFWKAWYNNICMVFVANIIISLLVGVLSYTIMYDLLK